MANAARATFAPDPRRRALLAKVHIAKNELGLSDDVYEGVLMQVTGRLSAGECETAELESLVEHFRQRGFKPKPGKGKSPRRQLADHAMARKARALWISLYYLGAVDNPNEKALEAFAKRQLKVDALQWAKPADCYKLIEALKAMAERHGWSQRVDYVAAHHQPHALKVKLCDAILAKLKAKGIAADHWTLGEAAFRLCGLFGHDKVLFETAQLDQIAKSLGQKLRSPVATLEDFR